VTVTNPAARRVTGMVVEHRRPFGDNVKGTVIAEMNDFPVVVSLMRKK
jgi:hypothetical protein